MPTWLVLGAITFLIGFAINRLNAEEVRWFNQLRRPQWLTFERIIPLVWIFIFTCLVASASLIWDLAPFTIRSWLLILSYLLLELVILSYTAIMCRIRSLKAGTIIGFASFILGLILAIIVFPIKPGAGILILPLIFWSPVGTYVTWVMIKLNH
jgi:tryptophan-rich sensory protein